MSKLTITALELENVKRVRRVTLTPTEAGLTVIGGDSDQGKSSILDGIKWMLGGDRYRPTNPNHDGEQAEGRVELSNGIVVELGGKNGTLKVSDTTGKRTGITLVQGLVGQIALDLPTFLNATDIEKAKMLLDLFPDLGKRLVDLQQAEKKMYDERLVIGRQKELKAKHAADLPYNADAPEALQTGAEMAEKLRDAMAVNAGNQALRGTVSQIKQRIEAAQREVQRRTERVSELERALAEARDAREQAISDRSTLATQLTAAEAKASGLVDEDVEAVKRAMVEIDQTNAKVRQNMEKQRAQDEADDLARQYTDLDTRIAEVRAERLRLLAGTKMPLEGLSISEDGRLIYGGQPWDCMSESDRYIVGAAICAAVKPTCGFVLLDGLERLDCKKLAKFHDWLVEHGLQGIGTRVSTGGECTVIIEDGEIRNDPTV
jgi:predicted ATP-dependent endonuclease of OLD family